LIELFTAQFQTDFTCNYMHPDCDLAFALASLHAQCRNVLIAVLIIMNCMKKGLITCSAYWVHYRISCRIQCEHVILM